MRVLVLGSIGALNTDGRAIRLSSPLVQRLVAVLVTEQGRPVSVDRLVQVLWADSPPDTAAKNLQVYVSRLRNELGREAIVTSNLGYTLAAVGRYRRGGVRTRSAHAPALPIWLMH